MRTFPRHYRRWSRVASRRFSRSDSKRTVCTPGVLKHARSLARFGVGTRSRSPATNESARKLARNTRRIVKQLCSRSFLDMPVHRNWMRARGVANNPERYSPLIFLDIPVLILRAEMRCGGECQPRRVEDEKRGIASSLPPPFAKREGESRFNSGRFSCIFRSFAPNVRTLLC